MLNGFYSIISPIITPIITSTIFSTLIYVYIDEIKRTISFPIKFVNDITSYTMIIEDRRAGETFNAVKEIIKNKYNNKLNVIETIDGNENINYKITNGYYWFWHENSIIFANITDNKIELWNYFSSIQSLNSFKNAACENHKQEDDFVVFYTQESDGWSYPNYRRYVESNSTPSIEKFLHDVRIFRSESKKYKEERRPYRKGYLIEGKSGTGKTTCVEKIAKEHNLSVYRIELNSANMDDLMLNNLISSVPINSVILFDEFEKQYQAINKDSRCKISDSGILGSLAGLPRLNHGNIVILTVNDRSKIPGDFLGLLLRPGRIDENFEFIELLK